MELALKESRLGTSPPKPVASRVTTAVMKYALAAASSSAIALASSMSSAFCARSRARSISSFASLALRSRSACVFAHLSASLTSSGGTSSTSSVSAKGHCE